jgi:hypothetical protein
MTINFKQKLVRRKLITSVVAAWMGCIDGIARLALANVPSPLKERKSLLDFMADSLKAAVQSGVYTAPDRAAMLVAADKAWASALATPHDLYAPAGRYEIGDHNFPWRQTGLTITSLLDCKDVTIHCDGPATIFATVSPDGADVFQLNGLKNFHVKGFPTLTGILTGFAGAGSNGCSIVNGYDNMTLEIAPTNCYGVDKKSYIDGGKGLTIQCSTATQEVGTLRAAVRAKQCAMGFDFAAGLVNFIAKKVNIDVDLVAEDCYTAISIGAPAATGLLPDGMILAVRVKGQSINCQKDVVLGRAHGAQVDIQIVTNKSAEARRLDPRGVPWIASDNIVEALLCTYAHNSQISIAGYKGVCDYKARIGGNSAGASGLGGATINSSIYLDIAGTARFADVLPVNSGGNIMSKSSLKITKKTSESLHTDFYLPVRKNTLIVGP